MKITDPKRMRALVSAETTGSFHRDGWGQQHLAVAPPTAVYRLPGRIEIIHGRSETMAGDWARINIPEFSKKKTRREEDESDKTTCRCNYSAS